MKCEKLTKQKKSFYTQLKSNDQEDSLIFHTTTRKIPENQ